MKRTLSLILTLALLLAGCGANTTNTIDPEEHPAVSQPEEIPAEDPDAVRIRLSDDGITVDGEPISSDSSAPVYAANDIVFYLEGQDFTYGEGTDADAHPQAEADAHTVVHITQPGTYSLSGTLSAGQVAVDLGEEAEEDPAAVVTLILNGVDITCTVAPGIIFYSVYECCSSDEDTASYEVDTSAAGARVIIGAGTENTVTGSHVARIYKPGTGELTADGTEVADAKKLHKYDAAFYSKMTMEVDGDDTGVLTINADNEGLDSELHLTINGGNINITSGNDGINTNEDYVSVTTINGGSVDILVTGSTGEGDGIDSNGWLVINGGTVTSSACAFSGDAGIDSDMGIYLNGGTVAAGGNMLDRIAGGSATYAVFTFAQSQSGGQTYTLKDADGAEVLSWTPANGFTYLILSSHRLQPGDYTFWRGDSQLAAAQGSAMGGMMPGMGQRPEGMENMAPPEGEIPEMSEGMEGREPGGRGDFTMNEDGTVTLPDGTVVDPSQMTPPEGMERPEGEMGDFGGRGPWGDRGQTGEVSEVFTIRRGENYFSAVSEK